MLDWARFWQDTTLIRFGTSGWRAIISDEFTFDNVRRVTRAVARYLEEQPAAEGRGIAVGYDTRFLSEAFAAEAARVLLAGGRATALSEEPLPTPVLAFAILDGGLAGGINITASHNPPEYNGMKFSTDDGAPAPTEVTARIEELARGESVDPVSVCDDDPALLDPRDAYLARLGELVRGDVLRAGRLRVAVDARYGTARGWLDLHLERCGVEVIRLHDRRDPLFGGTSPDCSGANLDDLRAAVVEQKLDLGLATDGDGDRFGVVDAGGAIIEANLILALLVDYLHRSRGWSEGVGRTVATTHLVDRVAATHGLSVHETPVGFKYFNPLLAAGRIFLAGEESAGLSVKGHVPEKDGVLAACLVAEMVAAKGATLTDQIRDLYRRVGTVLTRREDRRFPVTRRGDLEKRLRRRPDRLAGVAVEEVNTLDGVKWIRQDGSWVLVRVSGTEPVVRVYAEAADPAALEALVAYGLDMIP